MARRLPDKLARMRPEERQRRYRLILRFTALVLLVAWSGMYLLTGETVDRTEAAREAYARIEPLVTEMNGLRSHRGDLGQLETVEAVARLAATLGLEHNITAIRGDGDNPDRGELELTGLTLPQLVELLRGLRLRGGFQTPDFSLHRNPGDERLADVRMTLER